MVNAGLLKAAVVDEMIGEVLEADPPDDHRASRTSSCAARDDVAWAVRKGSPKLLAELNPSSKPTRQGTLFGNEMLRQYLKSTKFVKSATSRCGAPEVQERSWRSSRSTASSTTWTTC